MHRHGYQGRKFGREKDQRNALMRGLAIALFEHLSIETTLPKAKDLRPYAEKLITKARNGSLADRRTIIAELGNNVAIGHRLVDGIAPQLKRDSGYLRIVKLDTNRVGDNAPMARIEFVDDFAWEDDTNEEAVADAPVKKPATAAAPKESK